MAGKSKFAPGMGSSATVKNTVNRDTLINNDIDTGYKFKYIPLEKIIPNELNKNFEQEEIEVLSLSIRLRGLRHNLDVVPNDDDDTYRLISGEKRYRAINLMPEEERVKLFPLGIPCKIEKKYIQDDENVDERIDIIEANILARDYTPKKKAMYIRELIKLYEIKQQRGEVSSVANEIMKVYNMTERMVRKYIAANRMIPELQNALDQGLINVTESETFSTLSEETQRQIVGLLENKGKVEKTDVQVLKKAEEEKKLLEIKMQETMQELESKTQMVDNLEKQIADLREQVENVQIDSSKAPDEEKAEEVEDLKRRLALTEQLLEKEEKEKKKAQTSLEKIKQETEEKKNRNITVSKEELKKAADYAKAENIQGLMFKQLKELEKAKDTIKEDETLKVQFAVIAEGLLSIFK